MRIFNKNKIYLYSTLICLIIFIGVSRDLDGQTGITGSGYELDQQLKEAKLSLGPFKIKPVLFLNNAGYDSNIYRAPDNTIKDYSATLGPGFNIYLPLSKLIILSIYESPQYVYFMETKNGRGWNNYFEGKIHFVLRRFLLTIGKGYSSASELWNLEMESRPRRKADSLEGSVFSQISKKVCLFFEFIGLNYAYKSISHEQSNIGDQLNRVENRANFSIYYQLSYRVRFFLSYGYGFFDFVDPLNSRDSKSHAVYSGFEFLPGGVFGGRINLGYKYFNAAKSGVKNYGGLVGDSGLSFRPFKLLNIRASYRSDVDFSIMYNYPYFIGNSIGGGVSFYILKDIRLDYDYIIGKYSYPESLIISQLLLPNRKDNYRTQSVGIYFRLKKNIGVGITFSRWLRDSNLDGEDAKGTFAGLNLTYNF
jgi:hypothetical protein